VLEALQRRLEQAAFVFYQKNAPKVLEKQKWSCAEEVEWNKLVKYLLKPENEHLLPDIFRDNEKLTARDIFKQTFDIRHSVVHWQHVSGHDIIQFLRVARDILIAFDDPQGTFMAYRYIAISLEVAIATE
jgi:hypothetical protein